MYIDDFMGNYKISTREKLVEILSQRYTQDLNYFILTFEESGFPQIKTFVC